MHMLASWGLLSRNGEVSAGCRECGGCFATQDVIMIMTACMIYLDLCTYEGI